jgi:hypothetical protein
MFNLIKYIFSKFITSSNPYVTNQPLIIKDNVSENSKSNSQLIAASNPKTYSDDEYLDMAISFCFGTEKIKGIEDISFADLRGAIFDNEGDSQKQDKSLLAIIGDRDFIWRNGELFLSKENEEDVKDFQEEADELTLTDLLGEMKLMELKRLFQNHFPKKSFSKLNKGALITALENVIDQNTLENIRGIFLKKQLSGLAITKKQLVGLFVNKINTVFYTMRRNSNLKDIDLQGEFPFWELKIAFPQASFIPAECLAQSNKPLPCNDPFWKTHSPDICSGPCLGAGCYISPISKYEMQKR